jgi:hypothetical protein
MKIKFEDVEELVYLLPDKNKDWILVFKILW